MGGEKEVFGTGSHNENDRVGGELRPVDVSSDHLVGGLPLTNLLKVPSDVRWVERTVGTIPTNSRWLASLHELRRASSHASSFKIRLRHDEGVNLPNVMRRMWMGQLDTTRQRS